MRKRLHDQGTAHDLNSGRRLYIDTSCMPFDSRSSRRSDSISWREPPRQAFNLSHDNFENITQLRFLVCIRKYSFVLGMTLTASEWAWPKLWQTCLTSIDWICKCYLLVLRIHDTLPTLASSSWAKAVDYSCLLASLIAGSPDAKTRFPSKQTWQGILNHLMVSEALGTGVCQLQNSSKSHCEGTDVSVV